MEASRSMLLLGLYTLATQLFSSKCRLMNISGVWKDCAIKVILSALRRGTNELRKELLTAIASSENVKLVDKVRCCNKHCIILRCS